MSQFPSISDFKLRLDNSEYKTWKNLKTESYRVSSHLMENNLSISIAESMTGGSLMGNLTKNPGISKIFKGGIVCYQPDIKIKLLGVPQDKIDLYSCESNEMSSILAYQIKTIFSTDVGIGITGLASPGALSTPSKPSGSVFISIYFAGSIYEFSYQLKGNRIQILQDCCRLALLDAKRVVSDNHFKTSAAITSKDINSKGIVLYRIEQNHFLQ